MMPATARAVLRVIYLTFEPAHTPTLLFCQPTKVANGIRPFHTKWEPVRVCPVSRIFVKCSIRSSDRWKNFYSGSSWNYNVHHSLFPPSAPKGDGYITIPGFAVRPRRREATRCQSTYNNGLQEHHINDRHNKS
mgnify:CR=1 FL=1